MARRPLPSYTIDGKAIYIPEADNAWDWDRVEAERKDYEEGEHPVDLYHQGQTRCRLESVDEYLDLSVSPEKWYLKDPPPEIKIEIDSLWRQGVRLYIQDPDANEDKSDALLSKAYHLAARHGVSRVENCQIEVRFNRDRTISSESINALNHAWPGSVNDIGRMVRASFRPLDEAEGK